MTASIRIADLDWKYCKDEVDESVLDDLERHFGVTFPSPFRVVMRRCHGGAPIERDSFTYQHPRFGDSESGIGRLLRLDDPEHAESLLGTMDLLAVDDQLPAGLVPFADDGGGDLMCLDYRGPRTEPSVAYWMHERPRGDATVTIAASFEEFLALLRPMKEYDPE